MLKNDRFFKKYIFQYNWSLQVQTFRIWVRPLKKKNPTSASLTFAFTPLKHDILKIDSRDMLGKQIMNMVFSSSSCHPNDTALFDGNFSQCSTVDILQIAQTPASLPCVSHAAATLMTFTFVFFAVPLF